MSRGRPLDPAAVERALGAWVVSVVLHDTAQGWFTRAAERWGVVGLATRVTVVAVGIGLAALGFVLRRAWRSGDRARAVGWVGWVLFVVALTATWTQTRAEVVHFGQYALVAALAGGGVRALALAAALGLADELYQWLVWYPGAGLDLRDAALDVVGAVGGALWSPAARPAAPTRPAPPTPPPDPPGSGPGAARG